ncbi:hypothetical protein GCM10009001_10840 [Virgibacillus siamensis]|uniref:Uncharacterized protein n=1 Tax=Virgibacillus siamensis TaxID=480071 RepID=A0ABN1FRW0_9BACI
MEQKISPYLTGNDHIIELNFGGGLFEYRIRYHQGEGVKRIECPKN